MRKIIYTIISMAIVYSCQTNEMKEYVAGDSVYFQLQSNWENTMDSISYTFAGKGVDENVIELRVNLQGDIVNYDRKINYKINEEKTTAIVGKHYKALEDNYILPADSFYVNIPITIYKNDSDLDEKSVTLYIELVESEELSLGITKRTYVKIIFSNMLVKPYYWESYILSYFGVYSKVKHEKCIEQLGVDFPETYSEYFDEYSTWNVRGIYMSYYFEENYPINDENGTPIDPWI